MSASNPTSVSRLAAPRTAVPRSVRRLDDALARLVHAADRPDFDQHLTETLQGLVSFDLSMISLYQDNDIVEVTSRPVPDRISSDVLDSYSAYTYKHSPFFQMHRRNIASGFYLMESMARNPVLSKPSGKTEMLEIDNFEEVGYLTEGWPKRLKELDIALRVSDRHTVQIALYRTGNRGFSEQELAAVELIRSSLMAICQRHWERRALTLEPRDNSVDAALQRLSGNSLSSRELEIMKILVSGAPEKDIAELLLVSAETVKTHRKRAYQKLGVASRIELLVKLLDQRSVDARLGS